MNAKLGRPKLDVTRNVLIGARFTPDEARQIDEAVSPSGKLRSEWIRELLLGAANACAQTEPARAPVTIEGFQEPDEEFLD
jgi:hypothetical protein